jgi:threonine dehydrogenase-like Zn-dependent dehydrogenase
VPLVIGCGPVGLAVIAALRLKGIAPIVASDFSPMRRRLAELSGAHVLVDPAVHSPFQSWSEAAVYTDASKAPPQMPWVTGPALRPSVIFDCVGVPGLLKDIMSKAPEKARIVVVGVCMEPDRYEPAAGISKELSMKFVLAYTPEEFALTLAHIAEGRLPVEHIVTGLTDLDGVARAFEELASPEKHAKVIVKPSGL